MEIGRKIYFDLETGNIIVDTGERQGSVVPTTVEQDIAAYKDLSERVIGTYAYIELAFGQLAQDFAESNGYRIIVGMIPELPSAEGYKALEFSYPDSNNPGVDEPVYQKPLSEEVQELKVAQAATDSTLLELMEVVILGGV